LFTLDNPEGFTEKVPDALKYFESTPGWRYKKWHKSYEMKKLLGISTGTRQSLLADGILPSV